jgi:endonuclease IV
MKIGVKTFGNPDLLKHFEGKVSFFEIQAIQSNDYSFLKNFSLPIVVHAEHDEWGINISDKNKEKSNLKAINFAQKIADMTGSKKIIVHPGSDSGSSDCSIDNTIDFLKKINDGRILIENLISFSASPEEIKKIIKSTGVGFCFDLNHSMDYALKNNLDVMETIKKFLKLNPSHFHIGDKEKNLIDMLVIYL